MPDRRVESVGAAVAALYQPEATSLRGTGPTRRQPVVAVAVLDGALRLPAWSYAFT